MSTRTAALAAIAAALWLPSGAAADGAQVFNFGQCVSEGFPAPSDRQFGPLVFIFDPTVDNVPPGLQEGPAENPFGQIACPVTAGP